MVFGDLGAKSRCCAGYSVVGAIFTLWVAIMLNSQPFFVAGVEDPGTARNNALGAFFMFISTFILSAVGIWYDAKDKQDSIEIEGYSETEYQLAGDFPNYGTST